mgnify:CR=1 FL=1
MATAIGIGVLATVHLAALAFGLHGSSEYEALTFTLILGEYGRAVVAGTMPD